MYTFILVEDEYDIRKAIIEIMDWETLGFQLVGDAENGQEALSLIETTNPDVVITDIKMPFMDGIELAEQIRESFPVVRTVFLTGMSDFEYAKAAIRCNVLDYILKPVTAKKLEQAMIGIRKKLDDLSEQLKNVKYLENLYRESLPEMRLGFLISLITSQQKQETIDDRMLSLGMHCKGEGFVAAVVCLHCPHDYQQTTEQFDFILPSMNRYIQQCCSKCFDAECFLFQGKIVCLLSGSREDLLNHIDVVFSEICQYTRKATSYLAYAGISRIFSSLTYARDGFESACAALRYRPVNGKDSIIHIADMEKEDPIKLLFSAEDEEKMSSLLKTGTAKEIDLFLDTCFQRCIDNQVSLSDYHILLVEMFIILAKTAKSLVPDLEMNVGNNLDFMTQVYRTENLEETKQWFKRLCLNISGLISQQRTDAVESLGDKAVCLIRSQYADSQLTLKEAAKRLHISATYLSSVIKKYTGNSFTSLLVESRMNHAKELLLCTGKKVFEIAADCGYQNQHYFSYSFKMYYGVSPNEMRAATNASRCEIPEKGCPDD